MKHVWKCLYLSIYANSISTLWEQQVFLNVVHARYLIVILVYSFTLAKSVVPMYLWIFVGCRMLLKWIQNSHDWGNFWTVEFCTNNFEYIAVPLCNEKLAKFAASRGRLWFLDARATRFVISGQPMSNIYIENLKFSQF